MSANIKINIVAPGDPTPIDPVVPNTGLFTHGIGGPEATIITVSIVAIIAIVAAVLYCKKKHSKDNTANKVDKAGKATKLAKTISTIKAKKKLSIPLAALALVVSLGTLTALLVNAGKSNTSAAEGDTENSLTVTESSADLTIEVADTPVFAVLPVEVTVAEATPAGYTLTAYTDSTDLVSTTDSSKVIPIVAAEEGELVALAEDTYGLALDNEPASKDEEVYTALSTDADNPTFITDKDYKATEANDTTTVYYGFYITPNTPYGTYESSDIHYNATTNSSKVIFNGNGLYFNNNPEQTTNDVEYITSITDKTAKYSHTPNIDDEGNAGQLQYNTITNDVVTIAGASKLHAVIKFGTYDNYWDYLSFWQGSHPEYTAPDNYGDGIKECGEVSSDGRFAGNYDNPITMECDISGDSVTFGFWSQPAGGPPLGYGYYAVVTGYDADGNIIYLPGNTQVGGEYEDPSQDLPYIFLGWNEDKDATTAAYESKNDIELNLPLIKGKTTELYAIWQHATKIHFDGNGSTSGEIPDKLLAPGKGTSLCGYYYSRDGYIFNNWNTKPDGSGESYSQCYWYTAPTDQSVELNLYAQWTPVTTIIYDANGGTGNQQRQTINAGSTSSIYSNNGFSRDGYVFSYWNTEPDGTGTSYYGGQNFTSPNQSQVITLYAQWISNVLDTGQTVNAKLKRLAGNSSASYSTEDTNVTAIARASDLPADFTPTDDNTISINGSTTPVYAWYDTDTTTIYYYTESDEIIMNSNSGSMFYNFRNLSDASSIADWNTTYVTSMSQMFYYAGYNATTFSLDLSSWDTSKVTNMSWMFPYAGYNVTTFSLDLSSWDTSKVTNMSWMFAHTGHNATTFSLDLSSWDTSKVTNMRGMFYYAGYNATTWSIGDLSSWDTSKVVDMGQMFESAGSNATTFSLDLSSWDTSKVTNMTYMFGSVGYNATTFSLDLSSWDTSKVTNMRYMFAGVGYKATTFSLDLSSWDTSKVTNMYGMFLNAGHNATTWSIGDLSSWDTSKVTDMGSMFGSAGSNATTFSLDLSSWDTSNVTNMGDMFSYTGHNATAWSVAIPPKTGDINNTTSAFYGQDSSIYASPPGNRFFTLAVQTNPNTTNTTGSLNSVNNAGAPIQDNSSVNRSGYTTEDTEDTEDTENVDNTSPSTTSTPSQQEPLGKYQSSTTTSIEDTNIVIPILIATSITLGTSALGLLIYKSHRQEDE